MRLRNFATGSFIAGGLMLAYGLAAANPGDPLSPLLGVAQDPTYFALATNSEVDFVLAWGNNQAANQAQVFESGGNSLSAPFLTFDAQVPEFPIAAVAMDDVGGFVLAWTTNAELATPLLARRFALGGAPLTSEIQVSALDKGKSCLVTDVGSSSRGEFAVDWMCNNINAGVALASSRTFEPNGLALLPEETLDLDPVENVILYLSHQPLYSYNEAAQLAVAPSGSYMTAWNGPGGIHARSFDNLGLPAGLDVLLVPGGVLDGIAVEPPGSLGVPGSVITWMAGPEPTWQIQAFDGGNQAVGQRVSISRVATDFSSDAVAETDANGNYVIVVVDGQYLVARFYTKDGAERGGPVTLPIDIAPSSGLLGYEVKSDASGNFAVASERASMDSQRAVTNILYVQRFAGMNCSRNAAEPV
jgi:hypothetical protein